MNEWTVSQTNPSAPVVLAALPPSFNRWLDAAGAHGWGL